MEIQAASLNRVMICNGSIELGGDKSPSDEPISDDKQEGIAAHTVAASVLSGQNADASEYIGKQMPNGVYITADMAEFISDYTDAVHERDGKFGAFSRVGIETTADNDVLSQEDLPIARIVGKVDHWAWDSETDTLYIDHFSYGWRIVEPKGNWMLIAFAIGVCNNFMIKPAKIVFTVFQPRPYHRDGISRSWETDTVGIEALDEQLDRRLSERTTELHTSENCRDCAAVANCPAYRTATMNAIDVSMETFRDDISNDEISYEMDNVKRALKALELREKALTELARHRISNGAVVPNYMMERALGQTKWNDYVTPETLEAMTGRTDVVKRVPISPAAAKKLGIPEATIKALSNRPSIGMKLERVSADDLAKKLFNQPKPE